MTEDPASDLDQVYPRQASQGRTFVYVLPCRDEDILKIGFSRDPVHRLRTLHRRFFDFFDLERSLLIETDHLRDARATERLLLTEFAENRAPAPLAVRQAAAGYTEWFRGVSALAGDLAEQVCVREGWTLHRPLSQWLRQQFAARGDLLFEWSSSMLDMIDYARFNEASGIETRRLGQALRHVLDTWSGVGMETRSLVPRAVSEWYESTRGFGTR